MYHKNLLISICFMIFNIKLSWMKPATVYFCQKSCIMICHFNVRHVLPRYFLPSSVFTQVARSAFAGFQTHRYQKLNAVIIILRNSRTIICFSIFLPKCSTAPDFIPLLWIHSGSRILFSGLFKDMSYCENPRLNKTSSSGSLTYSARFGRLTIPDFSKVNTPYKILQIPSLPVRDEIRDKICIYR